MQEHAHKLIDALDNYMTSKINATASALTASALYVSTEVKSNNIFYMYVDEQLVFNYEFTIKLIGATFIVMQIMHLIYRFYTFLSELYMPAAGDDKPKKEKQSFLTKRADDIKVSTKSKIYAGLTVLGLALLAAILFIIVS